MRKQEERKSPRPADIARELGSKDPAVRERACRSLVAIGKPAVPVLLELLGGAVDDARREAARALSKIRDPSSAKDLVWALEDELPGVRWLAGEGLIAMGRDGLIPLFQALIRRSDSVRLRQSAHHILRALGGSDTGRHLAPVMEALEGPEPISALPVAAFNALKEL